MQPVDVLIIDDDTDLSTLLKTILKSAGFEVSTLNDGKRALQLLRQRSLEPRLILLDIEMPGMSGYEVCESLQGDPQLALIPVIMITASIQAESRLQAFQMGAVGFMNKPIKPDALLAQVNKALDVQQQWESSFVSQPSPAPATPPPAQSASTPAASMSLFETVSPPVPAAETSTDVKTVSTQPRVPDLPMFESASEAADLVPKDFFADQKSDLAKPSIATKNQFQPRTGQNTFAGFCNFLKDHFDAELVNELRPDSFYERLEIHGTRPEQTAGLISTYTGMPFLTDVETDQLRLGILPMPFCRKYRVVPFNDEGGELSFAMSNPFQIEVQDALMNYRQSPRFIAIPGVLQQLFLEIPLQQQQEEKAPQPKQATLAQRTHEMEDLMDELHSQYTGPATPETESVEVDDYTSAPMIRLVNRLIEEAYHLKASDIHLEAREDAVRVRYRVDGVLRDYHQLTPANLIQPLAARLKIMAQLDIAERRLPQDGRIVYKQFNRKQLDFDLRVATAPMNYGEKIVMRILDKQKSMLPLEALGFSAYNLKRYRELLKNPYGMILHVGPTGSGKSMTLYSALNEINHPDINIQTAEDPIEYTLPNINQLQVQPEIGLSFARALRAYLRQDPDVILVGEIRDHETAHIAVEAALTGHLLLSTLHTNDAAATLSRFIEMGISPFMISPSVIMICAQRLVRCLCNACKEPYTPDAVGYEQLGYAPGTPLQLHRAKGCDKCLNTGYKGRTGIHELLIPDENIRTAITEPGVSAQSLKHLAVKQGMVTLYWDAMEKVVQGITSLEEALSKVKPDGFDSRPAHF